MAAKSKSLRLIHLPIASGATIPIARNDPK
jgi:hypothetical protein